MASSTADSSAPTAPPQPPSTSSSRPTSQQANVSANPVEMETLPPSASRAPPTEPSDEAADNVTELPPTAPETAEDKETAAPTTSTPPASTEPTTAPKPAPPVQPERTESEAIGPSTDTPAAKPDTSNGPVVVITLLLTTGARHPYKIDEKYLRKRNVSVDDMDPYNISVYTLKELIWRDWREEWEPRPTSPSSIRLIHFGRMLDDKSPLKECRFQTEAPNVVHMTVKPQEVVDEEDAKTGKVGSRREGDEETHAGCRCVIL
ncbi:ubiquitin-like protein [Westerdykella ornata]|uniref:Ubiquitin-like protein n=1 Tax=Westerdykella ornata TaxID=318751 RepID=A0A6A6JUY4_WESOR|nr:ubiquitin-like protein [Westerdykella ornata]KAF2279628.1 ubiquitin-like protein [Westerdykella ornata]